MGFLSDIGSFIMTPLYYAISGIMLAWHELLSTFMDPEGGLSWALSIIGLTLVIRVLLIPLFVKQIKSQRNMQLIQPKVKELQKKYGHDRQRLGEETMKLYKDAGTNPFASCLPLILQMPIFFALFRILDQASKNGEGRGFLSDARAKDFADSLIFGHIPIKESFWQARVWGDNGDATVMLVAVVLVIAMTATTFTTQRQLMSKNMPADALSGPYAQQQKVLLYVLPLVFGISGVAFPIGVLLYWTTSNLWTMGQQFYVIRNNPAPGTPAFKAKQDRDIAKGRAKGVVAGEVEPEPEPELDRRPAVRQQPRRQTKAQRQAAARPARPTETPRPSPASPSLDKTPSPGAAESTDASPGSTTGGATRPSGGRTGVPKKNKKKKQGGR
ncbi:membrane protein insertase YidC [Nocardioides dongxiaopingii]|nr:membrane protein insertase YidC [Nocardioides sp. S-1144]QCW52323.1 membrane protein insertase YidC [Nocardioides sp. S-1144]